MRLVKSLRSSRQKLDSAARAGGPKLIEALESRTLLSATLSSAIGTQNVGPSATSITVPLTSHFTDPSVTGTAVLIKTTEGNIPLNLDDSQVSATVQNFLHYVNSGEYNGTFIHRVVTVSSGGIGIVQGGGYTPDGNHIATTTPVNLQYSLPNTAGTIAMARTSSPNSATSEFFFNAADNSSTLGQSNGGGYAVFGQVIYNGMSVVNTIYNLPLQTYLSFSNQVPVVNYTSGTVQQSNLVFINSASVVQPLTFTVSSDNPSLVSAAVSGNNLSLNYGSGDGTAHITVTATDLGGTTATSTFAVNAGASAATSVTIGKGAAAKIVRFTDPDGTASQVTINGAGTASVQFQGAVTPGTAKGGVISVSGKPTSVSLSTTGTDKSTNVTITGKGGNGVVDLAGITTDASVHSITGRNTALAGNVQAAGGLADLTLRSTTNGIIGVGSGATQLSLNIDSGGNESVNSGETISNLTAGSWGAGAQIHAPTITHVNAKNFFAADVTTGAMGTFHAGSITGGTWTIAGKTTTVSARTSNGWSATFGTLQTLAIAGAMDNSNINSTGNIGAVNALSTSGSNIFAGVASGVTTLPSSSGDFRSPMSIGVLRVGRSFVNTNVAAGNLGRVSAGSVQLSNNGTPFGFATASILTFDARAGGKHLSLHKVTTQGQVDTALTKSGISAQNFAIRII